MTAHAHLEDAGGWIEWSGGECPLEAEAIVTPRYRDNPDHKKGLRLEVAPAWRLAWYHDGEDDDIVAYRVLS